MSRTRGLSTVFATDGAEVASSLAARTATLARAFPDPSAPASP
jgi:hypothetical protein